MPETGALPGVAPGVPNTAWRGEVRQEFATREAVTAAKSAVTQGVTEDEQAHAEQHEYGP